ncbi:hypothetical protein CJ030_MR7G009286 [Morella rubra]|uniref:Uncharacterized protein n=1 Tax=Morella rubra TaxID=262757 RepID=A0A6A1V2F9_9ROSI|nr:hypothetical protein CJ030_MR7G009286 [Morella rubra]
MHDIHSKEMVPTWLADLAHVGSCSVPILPDEKIRSPIGPLCHSTFSRSAAHLPLAGAHVTGDVDPDEVSMDGRPPPHSHPK